MTISYDDVINKMRSDIKGNITPDTVAPQLQNNSDDIERLAINLIDYPYDFLAQTYNYNGFKLNEKEQLINGILIKNVVMFYLPVINLGKLSLVLFIAFTGICLATKSMAYKKFAEEQKKEAKDKIEQIKVPELKVVDINSEIKVEPIIAPSQA
jgi:hypothetical protein